MWGVVCVCMVFVVCVCGVCGVSVCKATLARSRVIGCAFKVVPQYHSEESETRVRATVSQVSELIISTKIYIIYQGCARDLPRMR